MLPTGTLVRGGLLGLALLLPACSTDGHFTVLGYTTKPNYDSDIKTVRVPIFQNRTFRQGLEFDLTQAVVREIERSTPYKVVAAHESADTELCGTILLANKLILNRNQLNEIREAETTLAVELVWRDLRTGKVLTAPRRGAPEPEPVPPLLGTMEGLPPPGVSAPTAPNGLPVVLGPDGKPIPGAPTPGAVLVQSQANFIPELGESITTAYQKNVNRLAVQIVSMMESPW